MSQTPGLRTIACVSSAAGVRGDQTITSSAALRTVGLSCAIAANQTIHVEAWIPFTVGATGGVRAQLVIPAAGTAYNQTIELHNTVAPADPTAASATTNTVFTNALANAGTHWMVYTATVVNGATAGTLDLQMAQNTSDALSLVVLRGGYMTITSY
jgi:hypothetical protein